MHWCMDETLAVLSMLPFVGMFIRTYKDRVHAWFHRMRGTKPVALKRECPHDHESNESECDPRLMQWLNDRDLSSGDWYGLAESVKEQAEHELGQKFDEDGKVLQPEGKYTSPDFGQDEPW